MINFNVPPVVGNEVNYIEKAIFINQKLSGDGYFTKKCNEWFELNFNIKKTLLTTSCTHALEMAAILLDIKTGDEVIAPSFTFVSTVNAFVLRGAKIVFVDIRPDTMNINEDLIEDAITEKTKVILPVHYAGVSCNMDRIMSIAKEHNLIVVEDAAQGVMSNYKGKPLGSIGDIGTYSFHETKNYTMGEGGAILINNERYIERAEIIREKGTNRSRFFRGEIDKYTWVDIGSSFLPSDLNAAYLFAQLEEAEKINLNRKDNWYRYYNKLKNLESQGFIELQQIPDGCDHNAHIFYIKCENILIRDKLIKYLKNYNIHSVFHYVPLHSSPAGKIFGRFSGEDNYTTKESERILRLPLYYNMKSKDVDYVALKVLEFYNEQV